MRTSILFFILLAISSCKNVNESSLEINIDPLTKAYKKNNIEYYLRVVSGKDTIYTIDSVCVNENGLITLKEVKKGYTNKTSYDYDLLNRIIQIEHHSDIHYKSKIAYLLDEKSNNLSAYGFLYNSNTKSFHAKPNSIMRFNFENEKLIEEVLIDIESNDTFIKTQYKYNSKNKISEISKNNLIDKFEVKTKYNYRENNTLSEIIEDGEVKYISEKSGLIDSVKRTFPNEKIYYKYYFRKKISPKK